MGVIYEEVQTPNLTTYIPEHNSDGTEKHITCEGALYHVLMMTQSDGIRCSCKNCELNWNGRN